MDYKNKNYIELKSRFKKQPIIYTIETLWIPVCLLLNWVAFPIPIVIILLPLVIQAALAYSLGWPVVLWTLFTEKKQREADEKAEILNNSWDGMTPRDYTAEKSWNSEEPDLFKFYGLK